MIDKSFNSSESLKIALINFFNECEDVIVTLNLEEFKKGALRFEILEVDGYRTLRSNILDLIIWYNLYSEINKGLKCRETLQKAIDAVINVFDHIQDNDDPISSKYSTSIENELIFYYLDFKRAEEKCKISLYQYVHNFVEYIYSENLITYQFGPILGIKLKDPEISIGPFILYHPDDSFLTSIINDRNHHEPKYLSAHDLYFCPQNCFDTIWLKREKSSRKVTKEKRFRSPLKSFGCLQFDDRIDNDIWKLILTLRLYSGKHLGILSIFQKRLIIREMFDYENFTETPFLGAKFQYLFTEKSLDLDNTTALEISALYDSVQEFYETPLNQIELALEHYFKSFQTHYPVYIFTELIIALESVFNEKVQKSNSEKILFIQKFKEIDEFSEAIKALDQYIIGDSNRSKTVRKLIKLIFPNATRKERANINKFFEQCYNTRNDLIHGNINLDNGIFLDLIPDLKKYVRLALIQLISLSNRGIFNSNSDDYYSALNSYVDLRICVSDHFKNNRSKNNIPTNKFVMFEQCRKFLD